MLTKILTTGQAGSSFGFLEAASKFGLETGGMAPNGWPTTAGPRPILATFGLEEHKESSSHLVCDRENIKASDGVLFFYDRFEPTMVRAVEYAGEFSKPIARVRTYTYRRRTFYDDTRGGLINWVSTNNVKTLTFIGMTEHASIEYGKNLSPTDHAKEFFKQFMVILAQAGLIEQPLAEKALKPKSASQVFIYAY